MADEKHDRVSDATKEVDRRDAQASGEADRMPTPEEERLAEGNTLDPEAAASYKEMAERGANQHGEGRIEG